MAHEKFKEVHKAIKQRETEKRAFRQFKKQLKKLEKSVNEFESKNL